MEVLAGVLKGRTFRCAGCPTQPSFGWVGVFNPDHRRSPFSGPSFNLARAV